MLPVTHDPEQILKEARENGKAVDNRPYRMIPTIRQFHESPAQTRAIVGPRGSGKSSAGSWEICYFRPSWMLKKYGINKTRWAVVRNTADQLIDTTMRTLFEWFPFGEFKARSAKEGSMLYLLHHPEGFDVEILFRACERPEQVRKFKSLEITGYLIDESIEVVKDVKLMLQSSSGRYPPLCPVKFGIETTNPPDVEMPMYHQFKWNVPPPGPKPNGDCLENHEGFWQPPYENAINLRPGYYEDLRNDYADDPEWIDMYILGKPGIMVKGKAVYNNFRREYHEGKDSLIWNESVLYRGWDNSGNCPACVVVQVPTANSYQVLREFHTERENIVDFGNRVITECNIAFPNAEYLDWGDPAGANKFSRREGGFTSNAELMEKECGVKVQASEQNLTARIGSVQKQLNLIDGLLIDPSCVRLINGFIGGYCYPEIGKNSGIYGDKPEKNRFAHVHESLQYVLVKLIENVQHDKEPLKILYPTHFESYEGAWMR